MTGPYHIGDVVKHTGFFFHKVAYSENDILTEDVLNNVYSLT
jgi:hypothetical protein